MMSNLCLGPSQIADRTDEGQGEDEKSIPATNEGHDSITGVKFAVVIVSVTMAAFLYMLDTSIIATVSLPKSLHRRL